MNSRVLLTRSLEHRLLLASTWLKTCLSLHDECLTHTDKDQNSYAPTRLIDVGPADGSQEPFLQTSTARVRDWVTLSHCWGSVQPLKTTKNSLSHHQNSLPYKSLPRLFQEALETVRILGYQYLWIDSLCIIQDSGQDWQREASRMGETYRHCVFMISADFCNNHTESFFSLAAEKDYVVQGCHSPSKGFRDSIWTYYAGNEEARRLSRGILQSRAWALQEAILSPRTLQWTQEQLVWDCRTTTLSEEIPCPSIHHNYLGIMVHETNLKAVCLSKESFQSRTKADELVTPRAQYDPLYLWYRIVGVYCQRHMSFSRDKFPAISGIAKEVARHTGFDYLAGIWAQDFHNGLMWATDGCEKRSEEYVAPTWSWASTCNHRLHTAALVIPWNRDMFPVTPAAEVVDIDIKYAGLDTFSAVTSAVLRMKGRCMVLGDFDAGNIIIGDTLDLDRIYDPSWGTSFLKSKKGQLAFLWLDCKPYTSEDVVADLVTQGAILLEVGSIGYRKLSGGGGKKIAEMNEADEPQAPVVQYVVATFGLILKPTRNSSDEYERIGITRITGDMHEGWESQLISII